MRILTFNHLLSKNQRLLNLRDAKCCFVVSCPLENNLLWVKTWVRAV